MTHDKDTHSQTTKFKFTKGRVFVAGAVALAIFTSAVAVPAIADNRLFQHAQLAMSDGGDVKIYKAGWGSYRDRKGFSQMSDADLEKRVKRIARHFAIEVDATDEQEKKIIDVALATAKDLRPLHGEFRNAGEALADLLTAETVDRAAIEMIRAERVQAADDVSKTIIDAVADLSEILTPEQRLELADRLDEFKSHRRY